MSPSNRIPASARLIARAVFILPSGPHEGKQYAIELFEGHASQGFKTDYDSVATCWLAEILDDKPLRRAHSYSGERNLAKARGDFKTMVLALERAGAVVLSMKRPSF